MTGFNPCFNGRCKRTNLDERKRSLLMLVSILVLMEDVKELVVFATYSPADACFNPCFNGRCKRTPRKNSWGKICWLVSILVLMEDVKEHLSKLSIILFI